MKKAVEPYRQLILLALEQLESYVPASRDEYLQSRLLQDAILLQLFQIGENLARIRAISPESFEGKPASWHRIVGLRNLIAHEYWAVDSERIWHYLELDLADFRLSVELFEPLDS